VEFEANFKKYFSFFGLKDFVKIFDYKKFFEKILQKEKNKKQNYKLNIFCHSER